MFGFGKKARQAREKEEFLRIGNCAVEVFNQALERWRLTSLEMRRTMLEDAFVERLIEIEPSEGNSFQFIAEIEAFALMRNFLTSWMQTRMRSFKLLERMNGSMKK